MHTAGMEDSQHVGSWSFSALSHPLLELGSSLGVSLRISYPRSDEINSADLTHMFCVYNHHVLKITDLEISTHPFFPLSGKCEGEDQEKKFLNQQI